MPVRLLRDAGAAPRGGAGRRGVARAEGAGPLRARRARGVLPSRGRSGAAAPSPPTRSRTRGRCSRRSSTRSSPRCPRTTPRSSARGCSDRRSRPGFGDVVFLAEAVRDRERADRRAADGVLARRADDGCAPATGTREVVLAAKADRVDLFADGTFRVIDYKLSKAPNLKHVVQLPAYAAAARQRLDGYRGRQWQRGRRGLHRVREGRPVRAARVQRRAARCRAGRGRGAAGARPWSGSSAASSRPRRPRSTAAGRARSRRCAGRTSSMTSNFRLPFDPAGQPEDAAARAGARRGRPPGRRRPAAQHRAGGVGGHGQDARARRPVPEPAARRRRPAEHPRDDLHAQGRRRDAPADRRRAARGGADLAGRHAALARAARPAQRDRDQHHRRVLPGAAARVPAGGRPRSRVRHRRRDGGAAPGGGVARPDAAHLPRAGADQRRGRAALRGARRDAAARRAWRRCSSAGSWRPPCCVACCRAARAT